MTEDKYNKTLALVKGTLGYEDFHAVDLVIEVYFLIFWMEAFVIFDTVADIEVFKLFC